MKEVELYCEKQVEEGIKLNGFLERRFQSSTALFEELCAKCLVTVLSNQFAIATEDKCISKPVSGRVYPHPMHYQIGICAAWPVDENIKKCANRKVRWKDMESMENNHLLLRYSCSVISSKFVCELVPGRFIPHT